MNELRLAGCRNDTLLGYLKSLGVFRLLALQADANVRASWSGATLSLWTSLDREAIESFFLNAYAPTPILNPWNNGAGFDEKTDAAKETLKRIASTSSARWAGYRDVYAFIEQTYAGGRREEFLGSKQRDGKNAFVRDFRMRCPEAALTWLDAAIVVGPDGLDFPFLLGTGGNDGRLDFSVNFAARALDVIGDTPLKTTGTLLRDALDDSSTAPLVASVAIGQYSPRHAGGANGTSGFNADSLVNPWDYVLMLEGALLFSGAIGRRTKSGSARALFPFAFRSVAGGYGSASAEEDVRGEVWLPVWRGLAAYPSVIDLLRKGRADLPSEGATVRSAVYSSEAASAILTLGTALGVESFQRVAFAKRNGLAYAATTVGRLTVNDRSDPAIVAITSTRVANWIDRVRRATNSGTVREALRTFDERLFTYATAPKSNVVRMRQAVVVALAQIELAISRSADMERGPMPYLPSTLLGVLDDGSPEHRLAAAVASLGASTEATRVRLDLEPVAMKDRKLVYDASGSRVLHVKPAETLIGLFERRLHRNEKEPGEPWLTATRLAPLSDVFKSLTWDENSEAAMKFSELLLAYSLIDLSKKETEPSRVSFIEDSSRIPTTYALLKLVMDDPGTRDERIIRLLRADRTQDALTLATRRARAKLADWLGDPVMTYRLRDVSSATIPKKQIPWLIASLCIPIAKTFKYPINHSDSDGDNHRYQPLLNATLIAPERNESNV